MRLPQCRHGGGIRARLVRPQDGHTYSRVRNGPVPGSRSSITLSMSTSAVLTSRSCIDSSEGPLCCLPCIM